MDGAEDLKDHVETLRINVRDCDKVESFDINVPDAVGFLLLKTAVGHFRKNPRTLTISTITAAIRKIRSSFARCWAKPSTSQPSHAPWKT